VPYQSFEPTHPGVAVTWDMTSNLACIQGSRKTLLSSFGTNLAQGHATVRQVTFHEYLFYCRLNKCLHRKHFGSGAEIEI
jgi:hypothetical protein